MPTESVLPTSPFLIDNKFKDPIRRLGFSMLKYPLEKIMRLRTLDYMYNLICERKEDPEFVEKSLRLLNAYYQISEEDRARIPVEGPVIVVANHPFGAIEGLLMASLLSSIRPDFKIMANYLLSRIPEIQHLFFSVDPFGRKKSVAKNIGPLKKSVSWVKKGGLLAMFPAGEVAHLFIDRREVTDGKWNRTLARLIRMTKAPVLPLFFEGRNSAFFQIMGLLHPRLRTVLLPRELLNKSNQRFNIRVGNPISFDRLDSIGKDSDLMEYVRLRTFLLSNRSSREMTDEILEDEKTIPTMIAPADSPELLAEELNGLKENRLLAHNSTYSVYYAKLDEIPLLMREIGRLREMTFRQVGEGTGRAVDLDRFDPYYIHLFVWNRKKQELVGAYRIGYADEIIRRKGLKGLYTRTLFRYNRGLLRQISPAMELGRSFIRPEYQRELAPLHLLWRGIGQLVLRHKKYRMLFGPVSISSQYNSVSVQLMINFLKANNLEADLSTMVKPRIPPKEKKTRKWNDRITSRLVNNINEVSSLVAEVEGENQGVPILIKHYVKLGGRLLGFNIDPDFGNAIDGLILVDLTKTPRRILERYLGKEETDGFLKFHQEKRRR